MIFTGYSQAECDWTLEVNNEEQRRYRPGDVYTGSE